MNRMKILAAATMVALTGAAQAAGITGQGTWETTLQPRELDGNTTNGPEAFYDTALNITWLRNANANGDMSWAQANTWATSLTVGSFSGWRLPTVKPVAGSFNYNFSNNGTTDYGYAATGSGWGTASELGHLYYVTLGNKGYCTPGGGGSTGCDEQTGFGLSNTGDFQNLRGYNYWSGTANAPEPDVAWGFVTYDGGQIVYDKRNDFLAVAVRPGDVLAAIPPIPEPETYAMIVAGLVLTGFMARRRRQAEV